jgi:nucleoside-diphosphate-sugar epimerase
VNRYLLLGANGFLGSQVRTAIERSGDSSYLVGVSAHAPRIAPSANCQWRRMDMVRASVGDFAALLDFSKPDAVINCAGSTSGSPQLLEAVNATVVDKLVRAMALADPIPLVHMGSAAEYGNQPEGIAIAETATARPVGDYGRTKLAATELVTSMVERGAIRATVLRVFNPVGARAPANSLAGTAIREIKRALVSGQTFITLGSLRSYRDFLATDDVATAALLAIRTVDSHPILNVGRGVAMSCRSMVELLAAAAGFEGDVFESVGGSRRSAAVPWQQANVNLLRKHLQWAPTTPIAEAVADLWQSGI